MTRAKDEPIVLAGPCPLCGRVEPAPRWARAVAGVLVFGLLLLSCSVMVALVVWTWSHL